MINLRASEVTTRQVDTGINSSHVSWRKLHEKVNMWACQEPIFWILQEHPLQQPFSPLALANQSYHVILCEVLSEPTEM
jgi:hypothetical protein